MVGVCRHFTLLHVAMLRAQGVPARARCGFGAYFEKGKFVDHWVTEYWNDGAEALGAGRRPARRPPARAVQGRRSTRSTCRATSSWSPAMPGSSAATARPIRRPSASSTCTACGSSPATSSATSPPSTTTRCCRGTCGAPWPRPTPSSTCAFFDRLAELSHAPDAHVDELRAVYEDKRIAVPGTVFNAVLNRHPKPVH